MQKLFSKLSGKYTSPKRVQELLRGLKYNVDNTILSAERCYRERRGHCLEASFLAAAILEHHGLEPRLLSLASVDQLDHVVYVFRHKNLWGAIGKSRDQGLHGRRPVFRRLRDLVDSYLEPYVDGSGRIVGYALAHLYDAGADWKHSRRNLWKVERYLNDLTHRPVHMAQRRYERALRQYRCGGHRRRDFWW